LKINIVNISEEGLTLQFSRGDNYYFDLLSEKGKSEFSHGKVEVRCSLKKIRETVFIDGEIDTIVDLACCRCLESASLVIKNNFRYTLIPPNKNLLQEEAELSSEDLDFGYYHDDIIDLDPIIYEQIILQMPMKILCQESCKGLCPHCGINLNMASCPCRKESANGKFAALTKLKI
jgi:uncharacterized protein